MTAVSYEVRPLFAEPFLRANIAGAISPSQIEFIQQLKMVNNMENLISEIFISSKNPNSKASRMRYRTCLTSMPAK